MKPTLLILAAGIGSRYGGVKQMDAIGPGGESIIDYSVYDAIRAGFAKIVFVISKQIETDFKEIWEPRLAGRINHAFVIQDPDDLPEGFQRPPDRIKPWGTGQAVLAGRHAIDTPFAVINADDFYGREAYRLISEYLSENPEPAKYCMVGYQLRNTLSEHGTVSRGVCAFDDDRYLTEITEITNIGKKGDSTGYETKDNKFVELSGNTLVSMNIWGFKPGLFQNLASGFKTFLESNINNNKAEFLLPSVINGMVKKGQVSVKMLETDFPWFGVTYRDDRPATVKKINDMIEKGDYPPELWR